MTGLFIEISSAIDANEQAQRAADAAWESARWAWWSFASSATMFLLTFGLLIGAFLAAKYAKKTWEAAHAELTNSNAQLAMARVSELEREAANLSTWLHQKGESLRVFVRNGNGGPVYDVHCYVWAKPDTARVEPTAEIHHWHQIAVAPAEADAGRDQILNLGPDAYVFGYIGSNGERHTKNGATDVKLDSLADWKIWDGEPSSTGVAVRLTFRDSSGTSWQRSWSGKLTQLTLQR